MEISAVLVKDLREKTGAGMMDCKKALEETKGNFEQAVDFLRKKGLSAAAKKSGRAVSEGLVQSYIHAGGKIGVLLEVNCETDFVARNEQFQTFVKDIAMHIAAASPQFVRAEEVPAELLAREREIYAEQLKQDPKNSNKPKEILEKIVDGRMNKFYDEVCLLKQSFVKDSSKTVEQLLNENIARIGENMQIRRFTRFQVGAS